MNASEPNEDDQVDWLPDSWPEPLTLDAVDAKLADFKMQIDSLRYEYEAAGAFVRDRAGADVEYIHNLRQEADNLLHLVRGATLFGRYADDAERHRRNANRWRRYAVATLILTAGIEIYLVLAHVQLTWFTVFAPALPLTLLFTYASVESNNHRRSEFDRRRIYLRMSAIESYTTTDISSRTRNDLGGLLYKFIERHFIEPDLDSNDLSSVAAGGLGPWAIRLRRRRPPPGKERSRDSDDP